MMRAPQLTKMKPQSLITLALILGCLNFGISNLATGSPAIVNFNAPAFAWAVAAGQGSFYIPLPVTYAEWENTGSTIKFTTFTYAGTLWGSVGFSAVTPGSTMTLVDMSGPLSYTQSGGTQFIYCPTKGEPSGCLGGVKAWDAVNQIVTVTTVGAGLVILTWAGAPPPPIIPPDAVMAAWLDGDFLGGVTTIYTSVLGPVFYGIIVLLLMLPLYFKTNSIVLPLSVAILLSGFIEIIMPAPALDFGRFILIAGVAGGLFLLVTRGRSGS